MSHYIELFSPWPFFVLLSACLLLISGKHVFAHLDATPTGRVHKLETLDGLRGLLALAVFVHHATVTYGYVRTGVWQAPPSRVYALLGQVGVSLFFITTGYLFWTKLLEKKGKMDWPAMFAGRFFRIAPLYFFAVIVMFAVTFHRTQGTLAEPASDVLVQMTKWLGLGLFDQVLVNGYDARLVLAGVTWTLYYEWLFYFSLPALAVIAGSRSHLALLVAALWIVFHAPTMFVEPVRYFIALFLCGMLTASIRNTWPVLNLRGPFFSGVAVLILYRVFTTFDVAYQAEAIFLLGWLFLLIANGTTIFGLLTLRASKRLGNISYSAYLLHGIVLTIIFSRPVLGNFATSGPWHFWITTLLCGIVVTLVASVTFVLIERPGVELGRHLYSRYVTRRARKSSGLPI